MKKQYSRIILIGATFLMLGCAHTDYKLLSQNPQLNNKTSIVLIGTKGNQQINYLQFESWSKMPPACNYRFSEDPDNIIALKIDTPQSDFKLGVYTTINTVSGYTPTGISYGYIPLESKGIAINKRGIYYYGILNTDTKTINQNIDKNFLLKAKKKYKSLLYGLKPINFNW